MKNIKLKPVQVLAIGFFTIIMLGTIVLCLPICSKTGQWTSFFDSMFTSTSATCVTGLVVHDTGSYWSSFGQLVILLLIQIGGIGFMTIATLFSIAFGKKISLKQKGVLQESVNIDHPGGIIGLTKRIIKGTILIELIGAVVLAVRFSFDFGVLKGIYYGVFHSISAFCNAGFDLFGADFGKYSSLTHYKSDITVNLTISALIIIGGIGFLVWSDLVKHKFNFKKYSLHSKIVLCVTLFLLIAGTISFFVIETLPGRLLENEGSLSKLLQSFFQSVTTRTAGFNTCDIGKLDTGSKLISVILMFIGGSPGSTAGGIKTTTFFVIILSFIATFKGTPDLNIFKRRLEPDATRKALAVFFVNFSLAMVVTVVISICHNFDLGDVLIETFSAVDTVGITAGITRSLNGVEKFLLMILMYCGRVGSLSFAISFAKSKVYMLRRPESKISIG